MTPIPQKIRKQIDEDQFYKTCALYDQHGHTCAGRITMDHSVIYAGQQLQELWAIVPSCAAAHGVDGYKDSAELKELRLWVALNRASTMELKMISKALDYIRMRLNFNKKWGIYQHKVPTISNPGKGVTWYPIPEPVLAKIKKIREFHKSALQVNQSVFEIIAEAVDDYYAMVGHGLRENHPSLYTKLGFDK